MIHFDFIVTDEEADTLFQTVTEEIISAQCASLGEISKAEKDWLDGRIKFLEDLKGKMTNSRVP